MSELHPSPEQWVDVAQRLRVVRRACRVFLDRWAVARLLDDSSAVRRVAEDVAKKSDAEIADPHNRNWSILYRGSILDD